MYTRPPCVNTRGRDGPRHVKRLQQQGRDTLRFVCMHAIAKYFIIIFGIAKYFTNEKLLSSFHDFPEEGWSACGTSPRRRPCCYYHHYYYYYYYLPVLLVVVLVLLILL